VANGLPANIDAERLVLGSILLDDILFPDAGLELDLFSTDNHKRIARRMNDLRVRGERIDRVTLINEMQRTGEFGADTISYVVSLDDGLPQLPKIDSYIRILREKAARRRIIFACANLQSRAQLATEDLADIEAAGQELFASVAHQSTAYGSVEDTEELHEQ
jgi:replicative DNA helicase